MRAGLTFIILSSFFWLSPSAGAVKFENKINEDIKFILSAKHRQGTKAIPVLAHKSATESVGEFFEQASPTDTLWINARRGIKPPYNDMFCYPTLTVKELREGDNKYKITFDGKNCTVKK